MNTPLLAWLINATVATSIAAVIVLLLRKPLQRWLGAEIAFRLWLVLPLAALAACFSLPRSAAGTAITTSAGTATPEIVVRVTGNLHAFDVDRWLLGVWFLGAVALLALLIGQQRRFVTRLRLRRSGDGSWRSSIVHVVPAVLGVLHQKLVLPEHFETDYSFEEQQLVIAHERMHQTRRDPWALAGCALLRTVFWFNPIVHLAAGYFRRDVEMACDAAVLRSHPASRRCYAAALLKTHCVETAIPVGCLWHQTPPMKERIMLLKQALPTRYARLAGAITLCLAAFGTAGVALAGHDAALSTASALAATPPTPPAPPAPPPPPAPADPASQVAPPAPPAIAALPPVPAPPAPPGPPRRMTYARNSVAPNAPPPPPAIPAAPPAPPSPALAPSPPAAPMPPEIDEAAPPTYPKEALKRNLSGTVKIKMRIGADGRVKHAQVVGSTPPGVFDAAAMKAAVQWHFRPRRNAQGRAVESEVLVPVEFKM